MKLTYAIVGIVGGPILALVGFVLFKLALRLAEGRRRIQPAFYSGLYPLALSKWMNRIVGVTLILGGIALVVFGVVNATGLH